MNINTLKDYIEQFNSEIVDSGFKRDLQDYVGSLPNNQNNIVALREVANNISEKLDEIYNCDLPENLEMLLVEKIKPFTKKPYNDNFQELISDKEIDLANFFQKLNQLLTQLNNEIQQNITEIDKINKFIKPYLDTQEEILTSEEKAIIAIIFKDKKTITILTEFTKNLQNWNKVLPIYHQIISSSSPEEIEIVTVQNGSIDFLVNIDVNLAIDLANIFEIGFKTFLAYLSYKKLLKPISETFMGNKKLLDNEKKQEKLLIDNIGEAIKSKIIEQHKEALKTDKEIEKNADKKIETVVKLVTSHILKGNDLKLLALPENAETEEDENEDNQKAELKKVSMQVKQAVKSLPQTEMKKLLEQYKEPDENDKK
jgi:hypothetical protein